jgi:large subunit ribosomal protein L18
MGLRIEKRRRRENKTDYKLRTNLLKSKYPRIVVRITNKYFIVQVIESSEAQDRVIAGLTSKKLLENGWDKKNSGSLKSIPAGYLTGLMLAKKLKKGKFIVDLGMARTIPGSRVYSVVRGLVDGGLDIPCSNKVFPSDGRLNGEHLSDDLKDIIKRVKEKL